MDDWIRLAFTGPIVRRGLKFCVVVGTILIAINYGDAILGGQVTSVQYVKMGLTLLVPYCVSVLSSVGAVMEGRKG